MFPVDDRGPPDVPVRRTCGRCVASQRSGKHLSPHYSADVGSPHTGAANEVKAMDADSTPRAASGTPDPAAATE